MRILKISIIALTTTAFVTAILFCCCLTRQAQAAAIKSKPAQSHCHKAKEDKSAPAKTSCDCCHKLSLISDQSISIEAVAVFTLAQIELPLLFSVQPVFIQAFPSSADGPPQEFASVPLYIKHSVYRI